MTVGHRVDSAAADIDNAGIGHGVIVGHSMGGLTVPGVVAKLGAARVREIILSAALVPPQGSWLVQTLRGPLVPLARSARRMQRAFPMPRAAACFAFCNGMTRAQRRLTLSRLCAERHLWTGRPQ